jgi:2,3,4,5-tetrahydropyridine-2-carboxylate N-succinyltransferase
VLPHLIRKKSMTQQLQPLIDAAWETAPASPPASAPKEVRDAVEHVIAELNNGRLRVATREGVGQWTTHQWIKKAVLLSFPPQGQRRHQARRRPGLLRQGADQVCAPDEDEMKATGVRVVPPAVARRGSFMAKGVILMPST